jgi:hypothetical protein
LILILKPGYEDILGIAQGFEAGSRFFLDVGCFMFWDEVGQSSGSRCEKRFDDVVLQPLAYFHGPLLDHLPRSGLVPNVLTLEKIRDGMKKALSNVNIRGGVLRAECASRVVGNSLSIT